MRLRFGLRGLLLFILMASAVLAVVSIKLQQDYRIEHAFGELRALGFLVGTASPANDRTGLTLACQKSSLSDDNVERLLVQAESLRRSHDLGLSAGHEITELTLAGCRVSDAALARLRSGLPFAEIKR
jgi:hypothetical protein